MVATCCVFFSCAQLCEPGYSLNLGVCSECHQGTYGRVTNFGAVVFAIAPTIAGVLLLLYFCKV